MNGIIKHHLDGVRLSIIFMEFMDNFKTAGNYFTYDINTHQLKIRNDRDIFLLKIIQYEFQRLNRLGYLHNDAHLGDNVFILILFYIIKEYIEKNKITIFYYVKSEYLHQLEEFICCKNIKLRPLIMKPNYSLNVWIQNDFFAYKNITFYNGANVNYNKFYINFFNNLLSKLKFNCSINKFFYIDNDLINRYNKIPLIYKNFDILILNSEPLSEQYNYDKNIWDNYIIELNNQFKILTTTKVKGVLCTFDENLTIKDIASLSRRAKIIIAINSGVFPGLLNYYTLTSVKHFYIFDNRCVYSYPNFENKKKITDITINELNKYIN
jgi:hypothetical protein